MTLFQATNTKVKSIMLMTTKLPPRRSYSTSVVAQEPSPESSPRHHDDAAGPLKRDSVFSASVTSQPFLPTTADDDDDGPARPPSAPTRECVADIRRDFRLALIYIAAATVEGSASDAAVALAAQQPDVQQRYATQKFIFDAMKRSQSSFNDLQLALYYLVRLRSAQQQDPKATPAPPSSPGTEADRINPEMEVPPRPEASPGSAPSSHPPSLASLCTFPTATATPAPAATTNTTTTFLACLILAWKYLHDRTYTARAWSTITGVPVSAINARSEPCWRGWGTGCTWTGGRAPLRGSPRCRRGRRCGLLG
ncbi:hypothetical protein DFJ73DRAFT_965751 [Zopfochytrium polystomum]|nr:hypothetical protein DFJ73DRAFT_965751 [Zopfochytrium polystomum]